MMLRKNLLARVQRWWRGPLWAVDITVTGSDGTFLGKTIAPVPARGWSMASAMRDAMDQQGWEWIAHMMKHDHCTISTISLEARLVEQKNA